MIRNTTLPSLATIGVALFMMSAPGQTSQAFTCDDPQASRDQLEKCDDFENLLRIDPLKDDPDPCLYLAIPYDFCLRTIGKEWWERQVKNAPPSLESRIKELEKRIKELERLIAAGKP